MLRKIEVSLVYTQVTIIDMSGGLFQESRILFLANLRFIGWSCAK